jgi:hypothetical protein
MQVRGNQTAMGVALNRLMGGASNAGCGFKHTTQAIEDLIRTLLL